MPRSAHAAVDLALMESNRLLAHSLLGLPLLRMVQPHRALMRLTLVTDKPKRIAIDFTFSPSA
jgi:hypothetical protein